MRFDERMKEKARALKKHLVLPEGSEPRTLSAARILIDQGIARQVTLLGSQEAIQNQALALKIRLEGIDMIDPCCSDQLDAYSHEYYELRKAKGISQADARAKIQQTLFWGAMMVRQGAADAMVAGADSSTANVLLPSFQIIKTAPGIQSASSCFVMELKDRQWGKNGMMIFADCAIIPEPHPEQLAEIAISSAESFKTLIGGEPIVAMLSFSTKGSATHPEVDKVIQAVKIVQTRVPELKVDGEMQADAALISAVAQKKAPGSSVAGQANVLIFPNLAAGNIGYKLVQRLADAQAYGPFIQGMAKPVSDLSRGCSINDIVNTCAIILSQIKS